MIPAGGPPALSDVPIAYASTKAARPLEAVSDQWPPYLIFVKARRLLLRAWESLRGYVRMAWVDQAMFVCEDSDLDSVA
jgi:hypothetical protein